MLERRRRGEEVEVRLARRDEPPVGDVEETREPVEPHFVSWYERHRDPRVDRHEHDHEQQRREQPSDPATPERDQRDRRHPLPLEDEQRRDQEAREDEERVDAEEPALRPLVVPWYAMTASTATARTPSSAG